MSDWTLEFHFIIIIIIALLYSLDYFYQAPSEIFQLPGKC